MRQTEDVAEVLNHCASSNWSERKEGLLGLQSLLVSQRILRWDRDHLFVFLNFCNVMRFEAVTETTVL